MDHAFVSETRREYIPVGSAPASLLATVSETKARSMPFERSLYTPDISLLAGFRVSRRDWWDNASQLNTRPARERLGGAHDVHTGIGESLERGIGLIRIVDHARYHHGRGTVLQQVHLID